MRCRGCPWGTKTLSRRCLSRNLTVHTEAIGGTSSTNMERGRIVRVVADKSDLPKAATAARMTLLEFGKVTVVALNKRSVWPTLMMLLTLRRMLAYYDGLMPVFQPLDVLSGVRPVGRDEIPPGSFLFYVGKVLAGQVAAGNQLVVGKNSNPKQVAKAILARIRTEGHTALECVGTVATMNALEAIIAARRYLHGPQSRGEGDITVVLDPKRVANTGGGPGPTMLVNRFILLPCRPNQPATLLVETSVQVSKRPRGQE